MDSNSILAEIVSAHKASNLALINKDISSYINFFSDDLQYKQNNNKTINKENLSRDTLKYFKRINTFKTTYDRISFSVKNEIFSETLNQKASLSIKVFLFFSKNWNIKRKGIYKWKREQKELKIIEVEILEEEIF